MTSDGTYEDKVLQKVKNDILSQCSDLVVASEADESLLSLLLPIFVLDNFAAAAAAATICYVSHCRRACCCPLLQFPATIPAVAAESVSSAVVVMSPDNTRTPIADLFGPTCVRDLHCSL
jgi:hypothetical protein